MNKKELEEKFNKTQQELSNSLQSAQQMAIHINKLQGKLELLKEFHDAIPDETKDDSIQS